MSSQIYLLSPTSHSLFFFFLSFSFFSTFLSFCLSSFSVLWLSLFFLFSSFSPFSSFFFFFFKPIKKNQRFGQRIGCCEFVSFLGALRMLMNFLGLCFKLRNEVVIVGIGGWRKKTRKKRRVIENRSALFDFFWIGKWKVIEQKLQPFWEIGGFGFVFVFWERNRGEREMSSEQNGGEWGWGG